MNSIPTLAKLRETRQGLKNTFGLELTNVEFDAFVGIMYNGLNNAQTRRWEAAKYLSLLRNIKHNQWNRQHLPSISQNELQFLVETLSRPPPIDPSDIQWANGVVKK